MVKTAYIDIHFILFTVLGKMETFCHLYIAVSNIFHFESPICHAFIGTGQVV